MTFVSQDVNDSRDSMTRCSVDYHNEGKPSSQLNTTTGNQVKRVHGGGDGECGNACTDPL